MWGMEDFDKRFEEKREEHRKSFEAAKRQFEVMSVLIPVLAVTGFLIALAVAGYLIWRQRRRRSRGGVVWGMRQPRTACAGGLASCPFVPPPAAAPAAAPQGPAPAAPPEPLAPKAPSAPPATPGIEPPPPSYEEVQYGFKPAVYPNNPH